MSGDVPKMDYLTHKKSPLLWGSHLPVLQAVIDAFPITGALELGSGLHSTPVLFERLLSVVSVENDAEWMGKVRELLKEDERHYIAHYPFSHNKKWFRERIGQVALQSATQFYRSHMKFNPNLLFIDCYRGYRLQALIDLHADFDVIVYHDANPEVEFRYGYTTFVPKPHYLQFIDKTFWAHTGFLINSKFETLISSFMEHHERRAQDWAAKFSVTCPPVTVDRVR